MSDTRRHITAGWEPGNPEWDRLFSDKIRSRKHLQNNNRPRNGLKPRKFQKDVRMTLHEARRKTDELRLTEELAML